MKISLVMAVFNGQKTLERALSSIASQTHKVDEIVIVDDGSSDQTSSILKLWVKKLPITLIVNKANYGLYNSLLSGMAASTSDWVFRLDADDYWAPEHVEKLLDLIKANPKAAIVSSRALFVDYSGRVLGLSKVVNDCNVRKFLMWDNPLVQSAVAINRNYYFAAGQYRNVKWEDYDLWIRLLCQGDLFFYDRPTSFYSVSLDSLSRVDFKVALTERWNLQKLAMQKFFFTSPLFAIFYYLISSSRILWLKIKK